MYKAKLWDEDKWDIHSSYSSSKAENIFGSKKEDKKYFEQKYGSEDKNVSSDYMRKHDEGEKEKKQSDILESEEEEKNEKHELTEDDLPLKAAKEVFNETKHEIVGREKKDATTIEDAIKKAIEEEKKVTIMDN